MSNLQQIARNMAWKRRLPGFKAWNRLHCKREHPALERTVFGIRFAKSSILFVRRKSCHIHALTPCFSTSFTSHRTSCHHNSP